MTDKIKKIGVLVSGGGTNLQALIDAEKRGELGNGKISLVIASKPGVYAIERAANAGIESRVLARKDYDSIALYSKALADTMVAEDIDLVVLAGFLTIFDEQVYEAFPNRILNVHPALIPSFCGKGFYGLQKAVEVKEDDTPETLQRRIMEEAEWKILPEAVRLFCDGKITVEDNKARIGN